jgi:pyruvate/2-oxoglutarate/acetoin dehydrogenase E1 component
VAGTFNPIPFAEPLENAVLPNIDQIAQAARSLARY